MKRSVKTLALAVALFSGIGAAPAHAEGFKTGVDLVSSYVWRGGTLDDSPNIQPTLTYTLDNGIVLGGWGSYGVIEHNSGTTAAERYSEVDLSVTIPAGPLSFSVVDYYLPYGKSAAEKKAFDFSRSGCNTLEADVAYTAGDLSLLAAYNFAGADTLTSTHDGHAYYGEASYKFYNGKDGYSAKAVVGAGSKYFYGGDTTNTDKKLALVNTGISVSKDRYTASYVYNPISEKSSLVFMASF